MQSLTHSTAQACGVLALFCFPGLLLTRLQVAADSEIAKKAGSKDLYINTYNMRVPNARGEWPERFGGK